MLLPRGQVIRFRGRNAAKRARELADELSADLDGNIVTLRRDTDLGPRFFAMPSLGAELSGALEFGADGRRDAANPHSEFRTPHSP